MSFFQKFILRVQSFCSWLFYAFIGAPFLFIMLRFYSYKMYGRQNLKGLKTPFILVSNHLTLIDSWFVQYAVGFPHFYWKPGLLPWNLPEATNYFRGLLAVLVWLSRSIPIYRNGDRRLQKLSLDKVVEVLECKEAIHIFPEGTRSRTGRLGRYTPGIARIYKRVPECMVLPAYIRGIENVLPINQKWPSLFKKIDVVIGKPVMIKTEFTGAKATLDIAKKIFELLTAMEKDYFESGRYRAGQILKESKGS